MERISGVEKWQCANLSSEVIGLVPCADIEKAPVKLVMFLLTTYQERLPHVGGLLDCMFHDQWHATMSGDVNKERPCSHTYL